MKTSLTWLQQYYPIRWSAEELTERLTLAGLEVEAVERRGELPDTVVTGWIRSREKHPEADKLSVCRVDVGSGKELQVVCGAPNCEPGLKVATALPGAGLAAGVTVRKVKLRGLVSDAMMCSAAELGLGKDHSGLLALPEEAVPGTPVSQWLSPDVVIDWEVTPNRPDWLCHYGIAREIAALAGSPGKLRPPGLNLRPAAGTEVESWVSVEVPEAALCPRYTVRILDQVKIGPSPEWLQQSLTAVGVRPINNVVDVTNYVMMECGQPLHAFDYGKLAGRKIIVRRAGVDETLVTLDGQKHILSPDNLVIADSSGAVALAGVMGGINSEIGAGTTTVLLESAAFNPANVRATARRLGVDSESSYRFERGVDPEMVEYASRRAATLLQDLAGAELIDGCLDVYPSPWQPEMVPCRVARVNRVLGTALDAEEVAAFLVRLGLEVAEQTDELLFVSIPSFRLDLGREADLIEEVARLYGLDNIPISAPTAVVGGGLAEDAYVQLEQARESLLALGLTETMTYSTISLEDGVRALGGADEQLIKLINPISAEAACLRPSLVPGLLRTVAHNVAHDNTDLAVFEIGRVAGHHPDQPEERYQVGIAVTGLVHPEMYGREKERQYDFFDLKGVLEDWCEARALPVPECRPGTHPALVAGQCAELLVDGQALAVFGLVRDEWLKGVRLRNPLYLALLELNQESRSRHRVKKARPLPQYPAIVRDVSLIAPTALQHGDIVRVIRDFPCSWLEEVKLFDLYEDVEGLGSDRRSLAYSLVYRDRGRTLTDEEATRVHEEIKAHLAARLAVEFR